MLRTSNLRDRCSAAVLDLNKRLADSRNGSLIQVHPLREIPDDVFRRHKYVSVRTHEAETKLQGLPYAVAGVGDLLALFRCISCRFSFSTDIMQPRLLGAIGRVYTTSEPEVCGDVQKYDKQIYLRVSEAQRCRVHSTVVIPFFEPTERHRALGVIEVVKNDKGISFTHLLENVIASLENVSLCTSDINVHQIEEGLKQWPADNDLHMFDFGFDFYQQPVSTVASAPVLSLSEPVQLHPSNGNERMSSLFTAMCGPEAQDYVNVPNAFIGADAVGLQQSVLHPSQTTALEGTAAPAKQMALASTDPIFHPQPQQIGSLVELGERDVPGLIGMAQMNAGSMFQAMPPPGPGSESEQVLDRERLEELLHTLTANKYRKKRRQKMGSGKHLRYQDLQKFFGMGLKQAAAKLGICPTTLKRACRRNGIDRWPSRHGSRSAQPASAENSTNIVEDASGRLSPVLMQTSQPIT